MPRELRFERGQWERLKSTGFAPITDPFKQSRKSMHFLVEQIEARTIGDVQRHDFTYGHADLYHWLLLARAESMNVREQIMVDTGASEIALTYPAPRQLARLLDLVGEPAGTWRHSVLDLAATIKLIGEELVGIEFKSD